MSAAFSHCGHWFSYACTPCGLCEHPAPYARTPHQMQPAPDPYACVLVGEDRHTQHHTTARYTTDKSPLGVMCMVVRWTLGTTRIKRPRSAIHTHSSLSSHLLPRAYPEDISGAGLPSCPCWGDVPAICQPPSPVGHPGQSFPCDHSQPPSMSVWKAMPPLSVGPVPKQGGRSGKIVILFERYTIGYHAKYIGSIRPFIEKYRDNRVQICSTECGS